MRNLFPLLLLALLTGCESIKETTKTPPKQRPTGIVFNTSHVLYTGGLGESGVNGFCNRIGNQVAEKFTEIGILGVTNAPPSSSQAKITVTLSTVEAKSGAGLDFWLGTYGANKLRVRYSAQLDDPNGATLATWKHEVEEDSVDKLTAHMASDIVKYLKKGLK